LKNKSLIILLSIVAAIAFHYSCFYIHIFCFSFDNVLIDFDKYPEQWNWSPSILALIASLIILFLAFIFVNGKIQIKYISEQTEKRNKIFLFLFCILGGISIVLIQYNISLFFFKDKISSEVSSFELWLLPSLIAMNFVSPIAEELFFRKGIFNFLHSEFNSFVSIGISSILFAAVHFPNYRQMIMTFFGGILLGVIYKRTNKIVYPVVFHISWNTTVVILNFIPIL